jgi:glycogen(starch) synthase
MPADATNLRLLWITARYAPGRGGMAVSCDRAVHALRKRGAWIDLVYLSRAATEASRLPRENGSERVLPGDSTVVPHELAALWPELVAQLSDSGQGWTHVVAFGGGLPATAATAYAAWLGVPLVVLLRGNDFDTGVFLPERRAALEDALKRAASVGCVTEDLLRRVQRLYPDAATAWTPNGIDASAWRALPSDRARAAHWRARNVKRGRQVISLLGDLKPKKGVQLLLEGITASGLASRLHLLIVGAMPTTEPLRLPRGLTASSVAPLPRTDLIPYLLASDAVALPSLYEGFPNLLLEAAALGVPLLASAAGGAGVLRDGVHGAVFRSGDLSDCARAVECIAVARPAVVGEWRQACLALAQEYSLERECDNYLGLFSTRAATAKVVKLKRR